MLKGAAMNVRDFECRSYERAVGLLGGRTRRVVCNNTVLQVWDQPRRVFRGIWVRLHGHNIVQFWPEGKGRAQ